MKPLVLYVSSILYDDSKQQKFAGIQRYCTWRGWEADRVWREDASPANVRQILRDRRPAGCVVEGSATWHILPPSLFDGVPVSYIEYPERIVAGKAANVLVDEAAVSAAAFRELSAGFPSCYAAVAHIRPWLWSRSRVKAFAAEVRSHGAKYIPPPLSKWSEISLKSDTEFYRTLTAWAAKLPERCGVFVVNDRTARVFLDAAAAAGRKVPRDLTVVSTDNFAAVCDDGTPPLTSVQIDFERMGYMAASLMSPPGTGAAQRGIVGPLLVARRESTRGRGRRDASIADAVAMIRREACNGLSVARLAARFPFSRRLFDIRFRDAMGHSALDEITHVRLDRAFMLLSRTDMPIGAVPDFCGFGCYRALDRVFRTRYGMSMSEWRRRNS